MNTIAIIGASTDPAKYGNKAVRAYLKKGWRVFPVNPNADKVEGLEAFDSVSELPTRPDLVSVYVPPEVLLPLLKDIAARGCDELWLNPGSESDAVIHEAERLGLNVIQACSIVGVGARPTEF